MLSPCLWFDTQAEEAARFYIAIFPNSRITAIVRYPDAGREVHGQPSDSVMTVAFELNGHAFTALNGGPHFKFNEAVSFQIVCETQEEIDFYWQHLGEGGDPASRQCGWLKDKFGLSWQVSPKFLPAMMTDADPQKTKRAFTALLGMKKIDIASLQQSFAG